MSARLPVFAVSAALKLGDRPATLGLVEIPAHDPDEALRTGLPVLVRELTSREHRPDLVAVEQSEVIPTGHTTHRRGPLAVRFEAD